MRPAPTTTTALLRTAGFADRVRPFCELGWLSPHHAFTVDRLAPVFAEDDIERMLWFALTLEAHDRGHSALHLDQADTIIPQTSRAVLNDTGPPTGTPPTWPAVDPDHLRASGFLQGTLPAIALTVSPDVGPSLQVQRMAQEESWIAEVLLALTGPHSADDFARIPFDPNRAAELFGDQDSPHPANRALSALEQARFALITGGPGTGKTWTLVRVLAHVIEGWPANAERPQIRLAAPTGKAAVRMEEAIAEETAPHSHLALDDATRQTLGSLRATTLHRLLKINPSRTMPHYGPDNPLEADIVVVDEASMMDLPLTRKLLRALKPTARLVLVGDRDQLPSVDVGSFLGDLVRWGERADSPLAPAMVRLTTIHRTDAPRLKDVLLTIQDPDQSDPERAQSARHLTSAPERSTDLHAPLARLTPVHAKGHLSDPELTDLLHDWLCDGGYIDELGKLIQGRLDLPADERVRHLFQALDKMRLLAVHRRGPTGVTGLRRRVTQLLREPLSRAWEQRTASATPSGRRPHRPRPYPTQQGRWLGEPILITRNSPDVDLYNGDIGLILPGPGRTLIAAFPGSGESRNTIRHLPLARLPEHESAVVMTVHKSQGSQFGHAIVVLSPEPSPIQTRELIYTGLSRAKQRMTWVGSEERLRAGLRTEVRRGSLLLGRLGGGLDGVVRVEKALEAGPAKRKLLKRSEGS